MSEDPRAGDAVNTATRGPSHRCTPTDPDEPMPADAPPRPLMRLLSAAGVLVQLVALLGVGALLLAGPRASATNLAPGFEPLRLAGTAGGTVRATRFGNTSDGFCTGWIDATPSHVITLDEAVDDLVMEVEAPSDTTLVVLGPTGTRCNDDANDETSNPRIRGSWAAGEYRVYVGAYEEGQRIRYTLTVR